MLSIILGAVVLGLTIAIMEDEDFPGWGTLFICVLASLLPTILIGRYTPPQLFFVGPVVGAMCGGVAISATCGMSYQRASIAAGIYLAFQIGLSLVFYLMT
ncbi:MAG: hypothetical protein ACKVT0_17355 [Planctomycetaceae bacterium]